MRAQLGPAARVASRAPPARPLRAGRVARTFFVNAQAGAAPGAVTQAPTRESPYSEAGIVMVPPMTAPESFIKRMVVEGSNLKIVCFVPGGVCDALHFMPVAADIKRALPACTLNIVASDVARAAYALCPYVNRTIGYDLDAGETPDNYADLQGAVLNGYYDVLVTAKPATLRDALGYYNLGVRVRVGYVSSLGYIGESASPYLLTTAVAPPVPDNAHASLGARMYSPLLPAIRAAVGGPSSDAPPPPLSCCVGVPPADLESMASALAARGLPPGSPFLLAHGLPTDSAYGMRAAGFTDSAFDRDSWTALVRAARLPVVFAAARVKDASGVVGDSPGRATAVEAYSPGQLAALLSLSSGVMASNTAALPIAAALGKHALALLERGTAAGGYLHAPRPGGSVRVMRGGGATTEHLEAVSALGGA